MPARNVVKVYAEDAYYHVYNRGVSKQKIFLDKQDYLYFLGLLKRYLDQVDRKQKPNRMEYKCYADDVELLAYCLMPNHFHLLLYQKTCNGMPDLLKSVSVAYSMYFNRKYKHAGSLFQQRYRAVLIENDAQFAHISRYIHMNPHSYLRYEWSSIGYYLGEKCADWLCTNKTPEVGDYRQFLTEYESRRDELKQFEQDLLD